MPATSTTLAILATGARTPVGLDAASSAAAIRAGMSRLREHDFMVDKHGEPLMLASDPLLDREPLVDRFEVLVRDVLEQVLFVDERPIGPPPPIDVFVALPELDERFTRAHVSQLMFRLDQAFADRRPVRCVGLPRGHAGGAIALEHAIEILNARNAQLAVVAGVDSYVDADRIDEFEAEDRIAGPEVKYGFPPGEGAAALLVGPPTTARSLQMRPRGSIVRVATTLEPSQDRPDAVNVGEGMGQAIRDAVGVLKVPSERIAHTYIDLNGERGRDREFAYALLRAPYPAFVEPEAFTSTADAWGDVGAATIPLHCVLASQSACRQYAPGRFVLSLAGSYNGLAGRDGSGSVRRTPPRSPRVKVYVNPPKTPVTEGSQGMSPATLPNVCKMPGPPAPFVPGAPAQHRQVWIEPQWRDQEGQGAGEEGGDSGGVVQEHG